MRALKAVPAVLVLALLVCLASPARSDRFEVKELAYKAMQEYEEKGFHVRDEIQLGKLHKGESYYFDSQLTAGNEYFFFVGGDEDLEVVDIKVYDENWGMVAANNELNRTAEILYSPEWSGAFHVKITLEEAGKYGAYWFIISGYK